MSPSDFVCSVIEQVILETAQARFPPPARIEVFVRRETGEPHVIVDGRPLDRDLIGEILGGFSATRAKELMIQRVEELEAE